MGCIVQPIILSLVLVTDKMVQPFLLVLLAGCGPVITYTYTNQHNYDAAQLIDNRVGESGQYVHNQPTFYDRSYYTTAVNRQ